MNRDPILFRVDGTARSGWERLCRCLTFSAALQRRRRPTYFLSQLSPGHLALTIKRLGNEWLEADDPSGSEDDLAETLQEIRRIRPAAVVVDSPDLPDAYLSELVASGVLVVSIDHMAQIRFASQVVVNPLLEPGREAYEFKAGSQLLLGKRYALVRPEIRRLRQVRSQEPAQPFRVLLALGEDATADQIAGVARLLMPISKLHRIDIVVRPFAPELAKIQDYAAAQADRLELACEPADVSARITRCHFAITGGSSTSLELACIGIPQLITVGAEAHWPTARRLEEEGAAICVGAIDNLSVATVRSAVMDLLSDPLERQAMSRCGRKLIDGRGPDRLVTALEIMLHPSRSVDFSEAA